MNPCARRGIVHSAKAPERHGFTQRNPYQKGPAWCSLQGILPNMRHRLTKFDTRWQHNVEQVCTSLASISCQRGAVLKSIVSNVSQESPKVMLAKDKQKERAKVPMCVTDWVMLKLETGGGGHSWKANPEIVFKLGGMFK